MACVNRLLPSRRVVEAIYIYLLNFLYISIAYTVVTDECIRQSGKGSYKKRF